MKSIVKDWVCGLGLRHQGVLLAAVRGCDIAPKDDPSKLLARVMREVILNAHAGEASKAKTFISTATDTEFKSLEDAFMRSFDHYPLHYVLHIFHAAEVIGYHHPVTSTACRWLSFYYRACHKLHLSPESAKDLDARLGANEEDFFRQQEPKAIG